MSNTNLLPGDHREIYFIFFDLCSEKTNEDPFCFISISWDNAWDMEHFVKWIKYSYGVSGPDNKRVATRLGQYHCIDIYEVIFRIPSNMISDTVKSMYCFFLLIWHRDTLLMWYYISLPEVSQSSLGLGIGTQYFKGIDRNKWIPSSMETSPVKRYLQSILFTPRARKYDCLYGLPPANQHKCFLI